MPQQILYTISVWFLVFIIYSFLGWIIEIISVFIKTHRLTNRGFLVGPVVPIYGTGAILVTIILRHIDDALAIFIISMIGAGILEYVTSFLMEKLFGARWWDYSKEPFNLNGRICLQGILMFGVLGVVISRVSSPFLLDALFHLDRSLVCYTAAVLFIIFLSDIVISLRLISHFRRVAKSVRYDATDEISRYIRETIMTHSKLGKRLVKAFPNLEVKKPQPRTRRKTQSGRTKTTKKQSATTARTKRPQKSKK